MSNPCRSLIVKTEAGVFTGGDRIIHDGMPFGMRPDVELRPLQSRFEVMGAAPAKYWVLPLVNFIPDPWKGEFVPQLADHPLRLASWPALPDGLSEHDQLMASVHLHHRGGLYTSYSTASRASSSGCRTTRQGSSGSGASGRGDHGCHGRACSCPKCRVVRLRQPVPARYPEHADVGDGNDRRRAVDRVPRREGCVGPTRPYLLRSGAVRKVHRRDPQPPGRQRTWAI